MPHDSTIVTNRIYLSLILAYDFASKIIYINYTN